MIGSKSLALGAKMRNTMMLFLIIAFLANSGCGRIRHRKFEGEYSGFPRNMRDENQFKNTSLCKTTDDVLYAKPCAMTTFVSESFYKGYMDGLNGKKFKLLGNTEDYQYGHQLGEKDRESGASRKFEIKRK